MIELLIADVDGTLVTPDKEITERTRVAVRKLREASVAFAVTSGRPPRGMSMLVEPLAITTPLAAFNGGLMVKPDLSPLYRLALPASVVAPIVSAIENRRLDVWIYRNNDWFVRDPSRPHVAHEQSTVRFAPTVVASFEGLHDDVLKIVGIGDDLAAVEACEGEVRTLFGARVSAARSQPYYLDVTHPSANKGEVVRRLSQMLSIPTERIATIGDMPNDVLMFALSGMSIAMGNASPDVQRCARYVTSANSDEGFAEAIERFVLPAAKPPS
jgi:Cof subfamily protein (haloacid dehalogenase superfamily)